MAIVKGIFSLIAFVSFWYVTIYFSSELFAFAMGIIAIGILFILFEKARTFDYTEVMDKVKKSNMPIVIAIVAFICVKIIMVLNNQ